MQQRQPIPASAVSVLPNRFIIVLRRETQTKQEQRRDLPNDELARVKHRWFHECAPKPNRSVYFFVGDQ